jgi:hypothetical protein
MVSHVNFDDEENDHDQDRLKPGVQLRCKHIFTQALLLLSCESKRAPLRSNVRLTLLPKFFTP